MGTGGSSLQSSPLWYISRRQAYATYSRSYNQISGYPSRPEGVVSIFTREFRSMLGEVRREYGSRIAKGFNNASEEIIRKNRDWYLFLWL